MRVEPLRFFLDDAPVKSGRLSIGYPLLYPGRIAWVRARCAANTGGSMSFDVRIAGQSIFAGPGSRPALTSGETDSGEKPADGAAVFAATTPPAEIEIYATLTAAGISGLQIEVVGEFENVPPARDRYVAEGNLSALRVVRTVGDGSVAVADSSNPAHAGSVVGITGSSPIDPVATVFGGALALRMRAATNSVNLLPSPDQSGPLLQFIPWGGPDVGYDFNSIRVLVTPDGFVPAYVISGIPPAVQAALDDLQARLAAAETAIQQLQGG